MAKQKKVIDASVLIKCFSKETGSTEALQLLKDHIEQRTTLIVPALAFLETINAIRFKRSNETDLNTINADLWKLQLHVELLNKFLIDRSIKLAVQYKLTIYDAIYLAISQLYGCELITADKELASAPNTVLIGQVK